MGVRWRADESELMKVGWGSGVEERNGRLRW